MYTSINFKSKKAVQEAIKAGKKISLYQPGLGAPPPENGTVLGIKGPWFPEAHKWYGNGETKDGFLVKIK